MLRRNSNGKAVAVALGSAAVVLAASACSRSEPPTMAAPAPPAAWAKRLADDRRAKDESFRGGTQSPIPPEARGTFAGLDYFPPDPKLRLVGTITTDPSPRRFRMPTNTTEERLTETYGRLTFDHAGQRCSLQVFRFLDEERRPGGEGLFLGFTDDTSGKESYPGGRFVNLEGPEGGPFVLDFNEAYNPYCAYGIQSWSCPVPPPENRLPVRIEAGERGWAKH